MNVLKYNEILSFSCIIVLCSILLSCSKVPNDPVKGADEYMAEMKNALSHDQIDKVDDITAKYLEVYTDSRKVAFCIALMPLFQDPENRIVSVYFEQADGRNYPHIMDLMRYFVATHQVSKKAKDSRKAPEEDADHFFSEIFEACQTHNYDKAKQSIKDIYHKYSNVSDEEREIFFVRFQRHIKEDGNVGIAVFEFLNSDELKCQSTTDFKQMAVESLP